MGEQIECTFDYNSEIMFACGQGLAGSKKNANKWLARLVSLWGIALWACVILAVLFAQFSKGYVALWGTTFKTVSPQAGMEMVTRMADPDYSSPRVSPGHRALRVGILWSNLWAWLFARLFPNRALLQKLNHGWIFMLTCAPIHSRFTHPSSF